MDYEKRYKDLVEAVKMLKEANPSDEGLQNWVNDNVPELKESEDEQKILFEELKALHLRMECQTVCNDAGGNRMWRRAWQHINEAINIIKEDKEAFKW